MERAELARLLNGATGARFAAGTLTVAAADPDAFMPAFGAAVASGKAVFLADPAWKAAERGALDPIAGSPREVPGLAEGRGWLAVPTGGSGGRLRWARHDAATLGAAIAGFASHFSVGSVNAVGVLPLHHVSGLLGWLRCAVTGGRYLPLGSDELAAGQFPPLPSGDWFLSLVPTQLQRLLGMPKAVDWLRRFRAVLIGGGPIWPTLAEAAASAGVPIALSYGMTETAAMVTAQLPEDFAAGELNCGRPLPHARVSISDNGEVVVTGASVFRGYWPEWQDDRQFNTADRGLLESSGCLVIQGRIDQVIITGGEKVQPEEVEGCLRQTGEFSDVAVLGLPHPEWGEMVVACYPKGVGAPDLDHVRAQLTGLAAYKHPKRFLALADWPERAAGKLDRAALRELAAGISNSATSDR